MLKAWNTNRLSSKLEADSVLISPLSLSVSTQFYRYLKLFKATRDYNERGEVCPESYALRIVNSTF